MATHPHLSRILPDQVDERFAPALQRARATFARLPALDYREFGVSYDVLPELPPGGVAINGVIGQQPMMALLAKLPATAQNPNQVWICRGAAMLAQAVVEASHQRYAEADSAISGAARSLRHFISDATFNHTGLSPAVDTPADWQEHLASWAKNHVADPRYTRICELERAFAFLVERRRPRPGGTRGPRHHEGEEIPPATGAPTVPPADPPTAVPPPAPEEIDDGAGEDDKPGRPGGSSGGGTTPFGSYDTLVDDDDEWDRPSRDHSVWETQQVAAIRAKHQDLRWVERHAVQAACVMEAIGKSRPLAALVVYCLYSGERDLLRVGVAHRLADLRFPIVQPFVIVQPFGLVLPNLVSDTLPGPVDGDGPCAAEAIFVQLTPAMPGARDLRTRAGNHLASRLRANGMTGDRVSPGPLFSEDEIRRAEKELRRIDAPRRITTAWLCNVQLSVYDEHCGGVTDHALLQRARDDFHLRTPAHYRAVPASQAARQRVQVNRLIVAWLRDNPRPSQEDLGSSTDGVASPPAFRGVLGSRRTPALDEVRAWVAGMQELVSRPPRGRTTAAAVRDFHNRYVVYVLYLLLWATGARPGSAAINQLLSPDAPASIIQQDKGLTGGARVAMLPDMARVQLARFGKHMQWLRGYLGLPEAPRAVLLDQQLDLVPLRPSAAQQISRSPFVVNANRHVFVSALRAPGVRDDRIALLMGHRRVGADPADPWSMMPPAPMRRELQIVQTHLESLGFAALPGFVGRRP